MFRLAWMIAALILALAPVSAAPGERLVMPFVCGVENGRLFVRPSADRTYDIADTRDEQKFTACREIIDNRCRTFMVHRFQINCGGVRVPWVQIAARIPGPPRRRQWIEEGRLNVLVPKQTIRASIRECLARGEPMGVCWRFAARVPSDHVVMPPGYAPLDVFGARLIMPPAALAVAPSNRPAASSRADIIPPQPQSAPPPVTRDKQIVVTQPLPPVAAEPKASERKSGKEWDTTLDAAPEVHAEQAPKPPVATVPAKLGFGLAWLLLPIFLGAAGVLFWVRRPAWLGVVRNWYFSPPWPWTTRVRAALKDGIMRLTHDASRPPDLSSSLGAALETVSAQLRQTEHAVAILSTAAPLHDVLESELHTLRLRLSILKLELAENKDGLPLAAPALREMTLDLDRICRIADGAAASFVASQERQQDYDDRAAIPRTKLEAYDVLGVNPDVSDGLLKKIVDALRMNWHPDHAKDERDRLLREDRIKQINIAWELINGKRQAA